MLTVEDSQRLMFFLERYAFIAEETDALLMGRNGSGPIGVEFDPVLASSSARSFPSMFECPGTQCRERVLHLCADSERSDMHRDTVSELTIVEESAMRAAWESECIDVWRGAWVLFIAAQAMEMAKSSA